MEHSEDEIKIPKKELSNFMRSDLFNSGYLDFNSKCEFHRKSKEMEISSMD